MTPWTPGGVLCYLLPSSGSFGRFGSSHPWMILLWGRKKETTAIGTHCFHSSLHMVSVFWHLSHRTSSNVNINLSHSSSSAGLDSLPSPMCMKEPCPPSRTWCRFTSVPALDHLDRCRQPDCSQLWSHQESPPAKLGQIFKLEHFISFNTS